MYIVVATDSIANEVQYIMQLYSLVCLKVNVCLHFLVQLFTLLTTTKITEVTELSVDLAFRASSKLKYKVQLLLANTSYYANSITETHLKLHGL